MSDCKWCDMGQHPFPAGQPGSTQFAMTEQVRNQWGGQQPHTVQQDVCAACAADIGFNAKRLEDPREQAADDYERADAVRKSTGGKVSKLKGVITGN